MRTQEPQKQSQKYYTETVTEPQTQTEKQDFTLENFFLHPYYLSPGFPTFLHPLISNHLTPSEECASQQTYIEFSKLLSAITLQTLKQLLY
jgi:hypothetical protein